VHATSAFADLLLLHGIPSPFEVRVVRADGTEAVETLPGVERSPAQIMLKQTDRMQVFRLPHSMLAASVSR
jgi:hypothetical protein